ncbi:Gfo/Idh/MocA family protein [Acidisphaera sp. L21]|uniref:Gfo/Idh/MocA family protein n=1 Tax=Acidisphaera sp. L21 TaxID=1641851 RepID=UPI00131C1E82|nr:Gfo/Idh/MocA family oxidoreductase [Acidisphaera sp. L21]
MKEGKTLRFGILGAANIARAFAKGAATVDGVDIVALASRDASKGRAFADEIGVARVHASYDALLDDPGVDAIYIPLPNTMHAEWAIRVAEAGKHILCEKPLASSTADAVAMFTAAKAAGVHLVEAYPYRAQPQTRKVRELLDAKAIGRLQLIHATFGFTFDKPGDIRLDPARGGGALLDAGSYATSFVRMAAGECPTRVMAAARWSDTGVETTAAGTMEFPDGLLAQIWCSFGTAYHRHALIAGDAGMIETTYLNHPPEGGAPTVYLRRGTTAATERETIETAGGSGFAAEIASFRDLVAHGWVGWTGATPQESVDIVATLEAFAQSLKTGGWVDVRRVPLA